MSQPAHLQTEILSPAAPAIHVSEKHLAELFMRRSLHTDMVTHQQEQAGSWRFPGAACGQAAPFGPCWPPCRALARSPPEPGPPSVGAPPHHMSSTSSHPGALQCVCAGAVDHQAISRPMQHDCCMCAITATGLESEDSTVSDPEQDCPQGAEIAQNQTPSWAQPCPAQEHNT